MALIVPPSPAQSAREHLIAEGRLLPARAAWEFPVPVQAEQSTEDVLAELRAE